jgi:cell division protein FtsL
MTSQVLPWIGRRSRRRSTTLVAGRGPRLVPLVFFTILAVAVFFMMIYLRIALDRTAFELDTIEREISLEESRQLDLRLELAELQDPLRIATEAQRIGLIFPQERRAIAIPGLGEPVVGRFGDEPLRALPGQSP